jgi:hypothetical protein
MSERSDILAATINESFIDPETGWDRRVVDRIARSIRFAHKQNPNCWAIHTSEGKPFIAFGKTNIAHLSRNSYQLLVDSNRLNEEDGEIANRMDTGRTYGSAWRKHLRLLAFSNKDVELVLPRFEAAHESAIAGLTGENSARSPWHQQQFVEDMERVLGEELPAPSYLSTVEPGGDNQGSPTYASRSQEITGYWKQTLDKKQARENWLRMQENQVLRSDLWDEPEEDLGLWPDDRQEFVRLAKKRDNYADGAAHRLWMFVKGMKVGDRIIAHADSSSILGIGTVLSDYQWRDHGHLRKVSWTNTESVNLERGLIGRATHNMNLWGLTPIDRSSFELLANAVGYDTGGDQSALGDTTDPLHIIDEISGHFVRSGLTYSRAQTPRSTPRSRPKVLSSSAGSAARASPKSPSTL